MGGEGGGGGGEEQGSFMFTPTWIIASVCFVIIALSYAMERSLHHLGDVLKKKKQKPLYEALLKVKEELMLLGFISLLLTVFQSAISKMCMPREMHNDMLPCKFHDDDDEPPELEHGSTVHGGARHLLRAGPLNAVEYCGAKVIYPNKMAFTRIHA
ncbi:putative utp-glucose-1-phosphate uridylyltransferase [Hibiscus syriacus]|uniref:Utp-glucose-1-phosphate uridylyltransferase n=1 Tax=Hibiscus syriacus TaxID=106335 RepID=A0A6A3D5H7_HIBSY|nr:putative utp-glucose-1-phosphate uridylyltransferase [Hibiscus syriacus]